MIRTLATAAGVAAALATAGALSPLVAQQQQQQQRPQPQRPANPPAQPRAPAAQPPAPPSVQQQAQPQRAPTPLPPEGTPVVVFDYNAVVQNSLAGQSIKSQLDKRRAQLQQEVQQQQAEFRKASDDLQKQQTLLSADALAQRRRDIEAKFAGIDQGLQARAKGFDDTTRDTEMKFAKEVQAIIIEIFQEQKYTMVIARQAVVVNQANLEITDEVVKRLNKKMATYTVNFAQK